MRFQCQHFQNGFRPNNFRGFIHELVAAVQNILKESSAPAICWKQGLNFFSLITEPSGKECHYTQITLLSVMPKGQKHTCWRKIHHALIEQRQRRRREQIKWNMPVSQAPEGNHRNWSFNRGKPGSLPQACVHNMQTGCSMLYDISVETMSSKTRGKPM